MADELWNTMVRFHHEVTLPALRAALFDSHEETRREVMEVRGDFADLRGEFDGLRGEFADVRGDLADLRGEFVDLRGEFADLREEFAATRHQFDISHAEMRRHFDLSTSEPEARHRTRG